ncbi:exported hypothetical protein [Frankia canadensis]|uniref:Secreted protein n=1 Tax=Frankia canadensis TaxID=1836972 RepID=A0A2I2KT68_9ACTN|nr:exported hypothetical protein [Frankia canadensis]SOU56140.1 exported hypothetical protein [Frankia canadensis]
MGVGCQTPMSPVAMSGVAAAAGTAPAAAAVVLVLVLVEPGAASVEALGAPSRTAMSMSPEGRR